MFSREGVLNLSHSVSPEVCWLPVKIAPQSKDGICFLSEHNGLQQPLSYVNKRGNGIPPEIQGTLLVSLLKKSDFIYETASQWLEGQNTTFHKAQHLTKK